MGGELEVEETGVVEEASGRGRCSRDACRGAPHLSGPPWTRIEEIPP
jgi:hypothetical protein